MTANLNKSISRILLVSVAIYFFAAWYVGSSEIFNALQKVDILVIAIPLLFSLMAYLLRFVRWQYYLSIFKKHVRPKTSMLIYFSGFALAMTPGKVGELLRCAYLKPFKISYKRSSAMFVVERFLDVLSMLCLSALAIGLLSDKLNFLYLIMALAIIFLLVMLNPGILLKQRQLVSSASGRVLKAYRHILDMLLHSGRILRPISMFSGLLLGVLAWFLDGLGFYYITSHFVPDLQITLVVGIYALSILLGAFSFMPGGVGATEALMYGFLHLLNVPAEYAVVIIILSRLTTIWFAVLLGAVSILGLGTKSNQENKTNPE